FEQAAVRIAEIHAGARSARALAAKRSGLDRDAMAREVRDRGIDRARPLEAEIAVARRDRHPRDRGGLHARRMDIELLIADAVERAAVAFDDLGTDEVAIERVRARAIGD